MGRNKKVVTLLRVIVLSTEHHGHCTQSTFTRGRKPPGFGTIAQHIYYNPTGFSSAATFIHSNLREAGSK